MGRTWYCHRDPLSGHKRHISSFNSEQPSVCLGDASAVKLTSGCSWTVHSLLIKCRPCMRRICFIYMCLENRFLLMKENVWNGSIRRLLVQQAASLHGEQCAQACTREVKIKASDSAGEMHVELNFQVKVSITISNVFKMYIACLKRQNNGLSMHIIPPREIMKLPAHQRARLSDSPYTSPRHKGYTLKSACEAAGSQTALM